MTTALLLCAYALIVAGSAPVRRLSAYPEAWVSRPGGRAGASPGEEGPGSTGQGGR
jgi:hypothetical protein